MANPQNDALSVAAPATVGYGGRVVPAPPPPPPPPPAPSITVTAGATTGTVGSNASGPTIAAPSGNASSVGWSLSAAPSGLTATPASGTLAPGASVTPVLSVLSAAVYALTAANTSGGTGSGSAGSITFSDPTPPPPPPPGSFGFTFSEGATVAFARNTTTTLATDVPADHQVQVSPDLLPGVVVSVASSEVRAVGDSTVPTVDTSVSGSLEEAVAVRDRRIEVIPNAHLAVLVNATKGITYSASSNNWNTMIAAADHGDTIEISPGYVHATQSDMSNYYSNSIQGALLAVSKAVNLKGMSGRGRWRLYGSDDILTDTGRNAGGIVVYSPADLGVRASITIEDFEFDNWAQSASASGVRVIQNADTGSWNDYHASITLRNFKIGKRPFFRSASGIAGAAQAWVIEDAHIYDTADGIGAPVGNDHNLYISGQTLLMRGVRANRTRSSEFPFNQGNVMDGHHAKLTFNTATLEGCAFDCGPEGDSSIQVQMKGGGNLIVRGCLFIAGRYSQTGTGNIVFEKESGNFGGWTYGLAGHSVLVERSVFISHYPYQAGARERAFVFFRAAGHPQVVEGVSSVTVRDNIGMNTVPSSLWIKDDPTAGGSWTARGNVARSYSAIEAAFSRRELLGYFDVQGPGTASNGSQAVRQFVWPHGSRDVTRSTKGLG